MSTNLIGVGVQDVQIMMIDPLNCGPHYVVQASFVKASAMQSQFRSNGVFGGCSESDGTRSDVVQDVRSIVPVIKFSEKVPWPQPGRA